MGRRHRRRSRCCPAAATRADRCTVCAVRLATHTRQQWCSMSHDDVGPPGGRDGEGRSSARPATVEQSENCITSADQLSRQCSSKTQPWRRRSDASLRLPPLDCGCRTRDPWICYCVPRPMSEKFIDAGAQAAHHLLDVGCVPLLQLDVLRALHRRGGDDRQLAQELYELAGGVVA